MAQKRQQHPHLPQSLNIYEFAKIPPQSVELEEVVLGAIMLERDALIEIIDILKPESFYKDENQKIFSAIMDLFSKEKSIDLLTVTEQLRVRKELDLIGGPARLSELTYRVSSAAHIEYHARIVQQKFIAREMIRISSTIQSMAFDEGIDIDDVLEYSESEVFRISQGIVKKEPENINTLLKKTIDEIDKASKNNESLVGIPSGFIALDRKTNGWQNENLIIIAARPSMGKGLSMNELILTNNGWVKNKDLKLGMQVASIDGDYSKITGIFPNGKMKFYKYKFSDGREIEVDESHLWEVNSSKFSGNKTRVLSTLQLKEKLSKIRYHRRISIPYFSGEYGIEKEFILHPYILGVLLGDGSLTHNLQWNKPDEHISVRIGNFLPDTHFVNKLKNNNWSIGSFSDKTLLNELKRLGLKCKKSHEKFIPKKYFHSSRNQRLELIRGLLDTDGSVDNNGAIEYSTSSEQLALDFRQLAFSLGYRCSVISRVGKLYGVEKRINYRLYVSGRDTKELFTLPRKRNKIKNRRYQPLTIISIEESGIYESQCISVSHPRSLYITKDYLVTHNTAFMVSMARNIALDFKKKIAIFSLEMSSTQLTRRLISAHTFISSQLLVSGKLNDSEFELLTNKYPAFIDSNIFIDDTPALTIFELRAKSRRLRQQHGIDIIMIDYLQLMGSSSEFKGNREQEVSNISRSLKAISKELNIPIICLSQLNRSVETRGGDKRPQLSDLRESGAIEQDADIVAFIHRPEYYGITEYEGGESTKNMVEILIRKHRDGALCDVMLTHDDYFCRISDISDNNFMPITNEF